MAINKDNLISLADRTTEEKREIAIKGGIASGEARREKATMKKALEMLLNEKNAKGKTYRDLATLGLIKGAIDGKAENYKVIVSLLGELEENNETPQVNINIVDNSKLEKILYEDNNQQ
ncbi:MAG: hypothetical protein VZS44_09455 [Bacilli bacterium]|nr:hypothetical protein [Bacilli bacterium]